MIAQSTTLGPRGPVGALLAHAGGIDEMLFVLVPLIVFLTLQWLSRRKAKILPEADHDAGARLEHRGRLAGGLVPETESERRDANDPPEGTVG
ncbi:MAG: hypothetical protein ACRDY7_18545 [Acidimicrobiia bacterium]